MNKLIFNRIGIGLFIFLSGIMFSACNSDKGNSLPNVIYILADDLGYGDVSSFNPESKIQTTNIDRLAEAGMRFTDAHTSSAVCTPTRYGILTGRYNFRSALKRGVLNGTSPALISLDRTTVAGMLGQKGYQTAFIGKWHLGWDWAFEASGDEGAANNRRLENIDYSRPINHSPNDLGFDYAYGHSASLDMPPYVYVENEMATSVPDHATVDTGYQSFWREGPTGADFIHEQVTPHFFEKAMEYVREQSGKEQPFFLYLALPSPHTPILPTEEWKGKSGLNPYGDFVLMVDDYVGQLVKVLDSEGITSNTLLIFTSDNGCSPRADYPLLLSKGHNPSYIFRGHKADIFEGGHRVPFIATWPDVIPSNSVSGKTVCTTDLFATLAEITGYSMENDDAEDSFSMLPLFNGEPERFERVSTIHHSIDGVFALRSGDWKLIMSGGSGGWSFPRARNTAALDSLPPIQLYNLTEDPGETHNLYDAHPEKVEALKQELVEIYRNGRSRVGTAVANDESMRDWTPPEFLVTK